MTATFTTIRHAFRVFSRSRGFALTAVVVIALGVATNVAVFSVADAVLFQPVGGPRSGEVVGIFARDAAPDKGYRAFTAREFEVVREAARPVARVIAQKMTSVGLTEGQMTSRVLAAVVSPDYFSVLDAQVAPGRGFVAADGRPGSERVVVVSHSRASRMGGAAAVVGRALTLNGRRYTVVGVAPAWFAGTMAPFSPDLWVPTGAEPIAAATTATPATEDHFALVASLPPGTTRLAASARLGSITAGLRALDPQANATLELSIADVSKLGTAVPGQNGEIAGVAFFMMGMAAVVLVIACLNLANLLLARGAARGRETAVRLAVGGSRRRILFELLAESMALSLTGAAAGLLLGLAGTSLLARSLAVVLPFSLAVTVVPNVRTLMLAAALAGASGLTFGLGPALRLARTDLANQLKEVPERLAGGRRTRARHVLVVAQLALSLVLLTAAGLFTVGAMASFAADPGFPLDGGVVAAVDPRLSSGGAPAVVEQLAAAAGRVRAIPGVASAALATALPYDADATGAPVREGGRPDARTRWPRTVGVTADYFRTVRLPLLRGRVFSEAEAGRPTTITRVAVVDQSLARELWPEGDPVGRQVELGEDTPDGGTWRRLEIVGVVAAVRDGLDSQPGGHLYLPFDAAHAGAAYLHVRAASSDPTSEVSVRDSVARELRQTAGLPLLSVKTLREHRDGSLYSWIAKGTAQVFLAFGLAALVLAVLGVYAVKSYLVACRRQEIGIRVALGATTLDILRLVIADGAWLTLAGLCVGMALSAAACQLLGSWVYGIPGIDPLVLTLASLLLGASSLLAALVPARRAFVEAPSVALRRQ